METLSQKAKRAGGVAQGVECLPMSSNPVLKKKFTQKLKKNSIYFY
jgi:hypothetical protein